LTKDQKKVWKEIKTNLISQSHTTNRLLVGDVGSGKTIIAILSCFLAYLNNSLSVILAPTEILAQQHYKTFSKLLKIFKINIYLLTSNSKIKIENIKKSSIIISTHAILYKKKSLLKKIALVIVDEQHKFGVKQRSTFNFSQNPPHTITMTATPIPRSISLTMLGNLSISNITTMPKNRLPVKSFLVPNHKKQDCYQWIKKEIKKTKCQAFVVCPFVEESETLTSIKSAKKEFEKFSKKIFPNLKLDLLHGKTKSVKRQQIIKNFQKNKTNILITTPIIEVGIDIPNSTILIIQSADRFGLAQLHQLRGRIGRGQQQSYCYLFTDSDNQKALNRLNFITKHQNGLKIAQYDLKTRGPGEVFSTLQHGFPSLKLANLSNTKLIALSQKILKTIIKNYPNFNLKTLTQPSTPTLSTITN
ncbi:MAG: DEAD/DEAH box helicase, partial [Proteobacteria bacterium]|nr:DEAD/DEAH box helicase [Pseudomonadota bacterium]